MSSIVTLNIGGILYNTTSDTLLKFETLANQALLEELLQEAEFYSIEKLVTEINSRLVSVQPDKKIYSWELNDYLEKGYHVVGFGIEPF
ncbi:7818_t:CDS:2 [Ambispora gerdemannii]|uniref:7818_t:CDS:1 n=1 Tax=Ambispora gerdemannii TaxID=144530 RepID=A0A9N8W0C3_9GLOM|nr:7818_t:CDS:2 [Ambispora gerdemannii]